jgi:acyl-CoA reductase-like NAD-dependent aldehyde dehydrogenase
MMIKDIYLAGEWVKSSSSIRVENPYDQTCVSEVSSATVEQVYKAIEQAETCKDLYQSLSSGEISLRLLSIANGIQNRFHEFVQLIIQESGKPFLYAKGEVERAIETFRIAAEESKRISGECMDLDWTLSSAGKKGRIEYKSAGIIAGISPFNFPLNLVAHKIAPAIATKSPIILKPSSSTPLTALLLAEVISTVDLPKGAVSVLPCSREVGQVLVEDDRIAVLSFTGSPDVGWAMKAACGKKKVVLELGGNAATIIHEDANMEIALNKVLIGSFLYSGQVCIHTQRIFVHTSVYTEFERRFVELTAALKKGNPQAETTQMSVLIDLKNAIRVEEWLNEAVSEGAEILIGGKREGRYFPPTIVKHAKRGMKIYDEEVFGPVVCLEAYTTIDEVIQKVNDSRFGLQTALFTNSHSAIEKCFSDIDAGALIVNDATTFRVDQMPYGGIKDSGFGREGVKYAMRDYLEPRLLVF